MKKIALLFAVGFAVVSCGGKGGWDAAAEKTYMDNCTKGGAATAFCECTLKVTKEAKISPAAANDPKTVPSPELTAKFASCMGAGLN